MLVTTKYLPWPSQLKVTVILPHGACPCTWHFSSHCLCSWPLIWAQVIFTLGSRQGLGKSGGPLGWVYQGSISMSVWGNSWEMKSSWDKREPSHTNMFQGQLASVQRRDICEYSMVSATTCPWPSSQGSMPESCCHSFVLNKHLVNICSGSGSVLGTRDTQVSKTDQFLDRKELNLQLGGSSKDREAAI